MAYLNDALGTASMPRIGTKIATTRLLICMSTTSAPTSIELADLIAQAQAALRAGDTLGARVTFRYVAQVAPESVEAWLGLGDTASVLHERRAHLERALALDPHCDAALVGLVQINSLLAQGRLIVPKLEQAIPVVSELQLAPAATVGSQTAQLGGRRLQLPLAVATGGLIGMSLMGVLTGFGIFVLTSFWGFVLACVVGPMVGDLIHWLSERATGGQRGRPMQIAIAAGMIVGGLGALMLGGSLMQLFGMPLPNEALTIAQRIGAGQQTTDVLLNNPGLLVFVGAAVGVTVFRFR